MQRSCLRFRPSPGQESRRDGLRPDSRNLGNRLEVGIIVRFGYACLVVSFRLLLFLSHPFIKLFGIFIVFNHGFGRLRLDNLGAVGVVFLQSEKSFRGAAPALYARTPTRPVLVSHHEPDQSRRRLQRVHKDEPKPRRLHGGADRTAPPVPGAVRVLPDGVALS